MGERVAGVGSRVWRVSMQGGKKAGQAQGSWVRRQGRKVKFLEGEVFPLTSSGVASCFTVSNVSWPSDRKRLSEALQGGPEGGMRVTDRIHSHGPARTTRFTT